MALIGGVPVDVSVHRLILTGSDAGPSLRGPNGFHDRGGDNG